MSDAPDEELPFIDQRIIVALQQDGRASWRAIAEQVGAPVATVSRRGLRLLKSGTIRVTALATLGSNGPLDTFLVSINCRPGSQLHVAERLIANPDVRFVTLVSGAYDIIAELVVRGGASHYPTMFEELQSIDGVERWRSDLVLHVYKITNDWAVQAFPDLAAIREPSARPTPELCSPDHLDDADRAIIAEMRDDARVAFSTVAGNLGMNESSVRRRFDRMRQNGCLDLLTLVPASALGMGAEVLLSIRVAPKRLESVAQQLATHPGVRYLSATLGENSLFCEVITPSVAELHRFISAEIAPLTGVQGWSASMELLFLKRGFTETPWWRDHVPGTTEAPRP